MSVSPSQFDPDVRFDDLVALTQPRSVMIVGASTTPGTLGHTTVVNVLEHSDFDFDGEVHLVNPKGGELFGKPLHASVAAVPVQGIDVALLLVPAESAVATLRACAEKGVRRHRVHGRVRRAWRRGAHGRGRDAGRGPG
ncbi:CoA-binding protein [Achromobacter insolitus]|uniref:CoA-binding protein n=1 Tax=Achromobacter insolitus TaxID=217204 RepID=UPI001FCA3B96|nr:CoA-binding protein [Achromobacter insolitus]